MRSEADGRERVFEMKKILGNIFSGLFDFLSAAVSLLFAIVGITNIPETKGFEAVILFIISLFFGGLFLMGLHSMGEARKGGNE